MKISFTTLGCKVNQYETSAIERMLTERGHEICPDGEAVDAVIINTCAVTAESGRKSRQAVRRVKRDNPGAFVAVCGCFSQISPEQVSSLGADMVWGSGQRAEFVHDFEKAALGGTRVEDIDDPFKRREFEILPGGGLSGRTRAFLKIQDGCDNFCSYCIIPYARGPVRSMPVNDAVGEAQKLAGEGYKELVITGIEISSYGKDFRDGGGLLALIKEVAKAVPGMRMRLGSLEPRLVTAEFCREISEIEGLCRHFHLSLQSGSDEVLRRMGRKYNADRFLESVKLLRNHFPGCAITGDLIVGFPGETESEFNETLEFIQKCGFSDMHIFPYSIRQGTKAADMSGQLDRETKTMRAKAADAVARMMRAEYLKSCIGSTQEVLVEQASETSSAGNGKGEAMEVPARGHAGNYCPVSVPVGGRNEIVKVKIIGVSDEILVGELLASV